MVPGCSDESNWSGAQRFSHISPFQLPTRASFFELLRWTTALLLSFWSHRLESLNLGWQEFMADCWPWDYGMVLSLFLPTMWTLRTNPFRAATAGRCRLGAAGTATSALSQNQVLTRWVNGASPPSRWRRRRSGKFQQSKVALFSCSSDQHFLKHIRPPLGNRRMPIITDISYHQQLPLGD